LGAELTVLVVGFNPSLHSAAAGHFYAYPGNVFWRLIADAGWTPRRLAPEEDGLLLEYGVGFMDLSDRPTVSAQELHAHELAAGAQRLSAAVRALRPRCLAFTGKGVFQAFRRMRGPVAYGLQPDALLPPTREFVLPSPSGRSGLPYQDKLLHYRALAEWAWPPVL
jgi:TDG/mug DNA glycosylase family protein